MRLTATQLRADLYRVLDRVLETGEPVEIERNGRVLRIAPEATPPKTFSWDQLVYRPGFIIGDPDEPMPDWSKEWSPFPDDE